MAGDDQGVIRCVELGTPTVVRLAGDLDVHTAPALRAALEDVIDAGHTDLLVDLRAVTFADSSGLGVLAGALRKARRRAGHLEVCAPAPVVVKILRISALDQVLTVHASVNDARHQASARCEVHRITCD